MDDRTPVEIAGKRYAKILEAAELFTLYDVRGHEDRPAGMGAPVWKLLKSAAAKLGCGELQIPAGVYSTIHHSWYKLPVHVMARHPEGHCVAATVDALVARKDGDFMVLRYEHKKQPYVMAMHPSTLFVHDNVWHENRAWSDDDEPDTKLPEGRLPPLELYEEANCAFPEAERKRIDLLCRDLNRALAVYE